MIAKEKSHLRVTFFFWLMDELQGDCTINLQA